MAERRTLDNLEGKLDRKEAISDRRKTEEDAKVKHTSDEKKATETTEERKIRLDAAKAARDAKTAQRKLARIDFNRRITSQINFPQRQRDTDQTLTNVPKQNSNKRARAEKNLNESSETKFARLEKNRLRQQVARLKKLKTKNSWDVS
jgi:hypothetical protein